MDPYRGDPFGGDSYGVKPSNGMKMDRRQNNEMGMMAMDGGGFGASFDNMIARSQQMHKEMDQMASKMMEGFGMGKMMKMGKY